MRDDIYTILENEINTTERPVRFSQAYELIPEFLPCVYFRESHSVVAHDISMGGEVESSTVYIQIHSKTNPDEIAKEIETIMPQYGYLERECELIDNADPTIERIVMTFNRVISRGDTVSRVAT